MTIHKLLWTTSAIEVLVLIRELALYPDPCDPWSEAWPYASPMYVPTQFLPLYERTER